MRYLITLGLLGAGLIVAASVRADRVHLVDGAVIEGKASRQGDKIVIELESGQITLDATDVARIDSSVSAVQRFEELEAVHRKRGVEGLMYLADYCRDHGMRGREKTLLESVLEKQPNHEEARARLGFMKTEAGWITRDEHMRAQGFVLEDGQYVTREAQLEHAQQQAEADAAQHEREKAKLAVEQQKVALEREKLELEREAQRAEREAEAVPVVSSSAGALVYGAPYGYWQAHDHVHERPRHRARLPRKKPFPIAGVRDPRDASWSIVGAKDPRSP